MYTLPMNFILVVTIKDIVQEIAHFFLASNTIDTKNNGGFLIYL